MNGEMKELYDKLNTDFLVLKATIEERWKNHDQRSEEIWTEIRGNVKGIFAHLSDLPCPTHTNEVWWLKTSIQTLWGVLIIGGLVKFLIWVWK